MPLVAITALTPSALDYVVRKHIPLNRVVFDNNLSATEDWEIGGAYIQQYGIGFIRSRRKQTAARGASQVGVPGACPTKPMTSTVGLSTPTRSLLLCRR